MTVGGELCVAGVFSGNPGCNAEGLYTEDRDPGLGLAQRILPVWAEPQPAKVLAPGGRGAGPPRRGGRGAGIRTVPRGCARWKGLRKQRRPNLHTNPSEAPNSFGPSGEGQVPPRSLESDIFSRTRSGRAVAGKAMEPPRRRTARFGNRLGLAVGLRASAHPQCTRFRGPQFVSPLRDATFGNRQIGPVPSKAAGLSGGALQSGSAMQRCSDW